MSVSQILSGSPAGLSLPSATVTTLNATTVNADAVDAATAAIPVLTDVSSVAFIPSGGRLFEGQGIGVADIATGVVFEPVINTADSAIGQQVYLNPGDDVAFSAWKWIVGGTTHAGLTARDLHLYNYQEPLIVGDPPRISTSFQVRASDGVVEFRDATQCGVATIPAAGTTIAVANTAVTANSVILATPMADDGTAKSVSVVRDPGVGFTITANDAADANLPVSWFIARY